MLTRPFVAPLLRYRGKVAGDLPLLSILFFFEKSPNTFTVTKAANCAVHGLTVAAKAMGKRRVFRLAVLKDDHTGADA